jgi:uncharacterized protein with GYD domain
MRTVERIGDSTEVENWVPLWCITGAIRPEAAMMVDVTGGVEWFGFRSFCALTLLALRPRMPRHGGSTMPTYISLCRWTQQGAQTIKESPARLDAAKKSLAADNVKILHFYLTTGSHDMVLIADAPNDEAMAKAMLSTISQGKITTQTSRAFTEDEFRKIVRSL